MPETVQEKTAPGPQAAGSEAPEAAREAPPAPKPPLSLKVGARVRYGHRRGKVVRLQGGGKHAYEVAVLWEDEKYPQWYQYDALELAWEKNRFAVL